MIGETDRQMDEWMNSTITQIMETGNFQVENTQQGENHMNEYKCVYIFSMR